MTTFAWVFSLFFWALAFQKKSLHAIISKPNKTLITLGGCITDNRDHLYPFMEVASGVGFPSEFQVTVYARKWSGNFSISIMEKVPENVEDILNLRKR